MQRLRLQLQSRRVWSLSTGDSDKRQITHTYNCLNMTCDKRRASGKLTRKNNREPKGKRGKRVE